MMRLLKRFKRTVLPSDQTSTGVTTSLSPIEVYTLLSNERRQLIIAHLVESEQEETNASEIADYLSRRGDDRRAAYISCTQQHLPRLQDANVIEYNSRSKEVQSLRTLETVHEVHQAVKSTLER